MMKPRARSLVTVAVIALGGYALAQSVNYGRAWLEWMQEKRAQNGVSSIVLDACVQVVEVDRTLIDAYDGYARLAVDDYFNRIFRAAERMGRTAASLESAAPEAGAMVMPAADLRLFDPGRSLAEFPRPDSVPDTLLLMARTLDAMRGFIEEQIAALEKGDHIQSGTDQLVGKLLETSADLRQACLVLTGADVSPIRIASQPDPE